MNIFIFETECDAEGVSELKERSRVRGKVWGVRGVYRGCLAYLQRCGACGGSAWSGSCTILTSLQMNWGIRELDWFKN